MNCYTAMHAFYLVELRHRYTGERTPLMTTDDEDHAFLMASMYDNQRERDDVIGNYEILVRRCGLDDDGNYLDSLDVMIQTVTANQVRIEETTNNQKTYAFQLRFMSDLHCELDVWLNVIIQAETIPPAEDVIKLGREHLGDSPSAKYDCLCHAVDIVSPTSPLVITEHR